MNNTLHWKRFSVLLLILYSLIPIFLHLDSDPIRQWDEAVQKHVDNYTFPFIVKYVPLNSQELDLKFMEEVEFQNIVSLQLAMIEARRSFYVQTMEEVEKVLLMLSDNI